MNLWFMSRHGRKDEDPDASRAWKLTLAIEVLQFLTVLTSALSG